MKEQPLPKKTYFAVLGNFAENNKPRGKIYSTSKLTKSQFFSQIANNEISADIQIDDLDEEEEYAVTAPLQLTPPVTPTVTPPSRPSTPIESAQKTESPPPIPPASESQSPINVANNNTIPNIPPLSETEKTHVEEMKREQRTNLPEGKLNQLPTEETKEEEKIQVEEEKKDDSETQPKATIEKQLPEATVEKQLRPLIQKLMKLMKTPTGNKNEITDIITNMLSKIAGVVDETERNKLFETFIQKLYEIKIVGKDQSLYDDNKSLIEQYSTYEPDKPTEPRNARKVPIEKTKNTIDTTNITSTTQNADEQEPWKTAKPIRK